MNSEFHEQYRRLGLNISYYRKLRGFSQLQLAEALNISRTHMSRIEIADCAVSLDVIFKLAQILRIDTALLFEMK